jgi:hypothetical protein
MSPSEAREIVKTFCSERWDDQKIAEVLAFAEDGKMGVFLPCCCIVGVHTSKNLHQNCGDNHYFNGRLEDPTLGAVELAYMSLCIHKEWEWKSSGFPKLLREIIAEREGARRVDPVEEPVCRS